MPVFVEDKPNEIELEEMKLRTPAPVTDAVSIEEPLVDAYATADKLIDPVEGGNNTKVYPETP
jgi:hypothetical protein